MMARLSEEADAFERLAPQVLGKETLHQRAMKPPSRFHPRVGAAAMTAPPPQWKEREIVSQYGFTSFTNDLAALHELRQVTSVDGRKVEDEKKAQDTLAKAITASDDERKKQILKQFAKYGLLGAVTDFGQILLLFTRRDLERYEFRLGETEILGDTRTQVFHYQQLDGPEALTLFDANRDDQPRRLRIEGDVWVREDNAMPVRISLAANEGESGAGMREEATVDYAMSGYGALLPTQTLHRELHNGKLAAENKFVYTEFHKFGASSDIQFNVTQ